MEEEPPPETPDQRAIEGILAEALRIEQRSDDAFVGKILTSVDGEIASEEVRSARDFWRSGRMAMAAAVAITGLLLFLLFEPKSQAIAEIRNVEGDVFRVTGRERAATALRSGDPVFQGDQLICGSVGSFVTEFEDGTSISLEDGALTLPKETAGSGGKAFDLESGRALITATRQPDDQRLMFTTPHGGGEVHGTVFEVQVRPDSTRVRTFEGDVEVWKESEQDRTQAVKAGFSAVIQLDVPLVAQSFDVTDLRPGDIAWSQRFDQRFTGGASIEGRFVTLRENGQEIRAIGSVPVDPINYSSSFRPDQWISLELFSRKALFLAPADLEIVLMVRAEEENGTIQVALSPENPVREAEHTITEPIPVSRKWSRIRLSFDMFQPYFESRQPVEGLPVRAVAIWGKHTGVISVDRIVVRRGDR